MVAAQTLNDCQRKPWIGHVCVVRALASKGLDEGDDAPSFLLKRIDHLKIELGKTVVVVWIGETPGAHLGENMGYPGEVGPPRSMFWCVGIRPNPKRKRQALVFDHRREQIGILRDRRTA